MSTKIQWTDETWNPTTGCSRVSEGCRNCYIERTPPFRMNGRKLGDPVQLHPDRLDAPLHWTKPRRVFVNSLSDLFHWDVPFEFITAVLGVMAVRPDHTFQVLTKRPERMRDYFSWLNERGGLGRFIRSIRVDGDRTIPNFFESVTRVAVYRDKVHRAKDDPWMQVFNMAACIGGESLMPNLWLGVSVEDQQTADERIPILLQTPAAVRWISAEPLLGPVDLTKLPIPDDALLPEHVTSHGFHFNALHRDEDTYMHSTKHHLDWVVAGGESGPGARPCDMAWIRSIMEQCKAASVPVFVKQLGKKPMGLSDDCDRCNLQIDGGSHGVDCSGGSVLKDKKGGDMAEWPADLRVREWPR